MSQRAEQHCPIVDHQSVCVRWDGTEYHITGADPADEVELSMRSALTVVFARLHRHALQRLGGHIRIHAASGIGRDGMVLLVGGKRSGKSTLAVQLMLHGLDMVGDEMVLLHQGAAITFPRRFYLRHGAVPLMPGLHALTERPAWIETERDGRLMAIDPVNLGRPWRIRSAPVVAVAFVEPNHGGRSSVVPCSKVEMVERVFAQCTPPLSGRPDWLADLCRTINQAKTVTAHVGDLPSAAGLLGQLLH